MSAALHGGAAVGLVVGAAGHARGGPADAPGSIEVEIAAPEAPKPPADAPEPPPEPASAQPASRSAPSHTHDYPVPPSHDAHPHDPSVVHDHDQGPVVDRSPATEGAPSAVAAEPAPMPRFTIAIGNAKARAGAAPARGDGETARGEAAGGAAGEILSEGQVSSPAKLVASVAASYPPLARASEIEADVPLEIVVDTEGRVIDARVVARAGSGFDESALSAVKRYRFAAARHDGKPVRVRMRWSVQFRLR
jgi:TonB family protein